MKAIESLKNAKMAKNVQKILLIFKGLSLMAIKGHKNTHGTLSAVNEHPKIVLEQLKPLKVAKMAKV